MSVVVILLGLVPAAAVGQQATLRVYHGAEVTPIDYDLDGGVARTLDTNFARVRPQSSEVCVVDAQVGHSPPQPSLPLIQV